MGRHQQLVSKAESAVLWHTAQFEWKRKNMLVSHNFRFQNETVTINSDVMMLYLLKGSHCWLILNEQSGPNAPSQTLLAESVGPGAFGWKLLAWSILHGAFCQESSAWKVLPGNFSLERSARTNRPEQFCPAGSVGSVYSVRSVLSRAVSQESSSSKLRPYEFSQEESAGRVWLGAFGQESSGWTFQAKLFQPNTHRWTLPAGHSRANAPGQNIAQERLAGSVQMGVLAGIILSVQTGAFGCECLLD